MLTMQALFQLLNTRTRTLARTHTHTHSYAASTHALACVLWMLFAFWGPDTCLTHDTTQHLLTEVHVHQLWFSSSICKLFISEEKFIHVYPIGLRKPASDLLISPSSRVPQTSQFHWRTLVSSVSLENFSSISFYWRTSVSSASLQNVSFTEERLFHQFSEQTSVLTASVENVRFINITEERQLHRRTSVSSGLLKNVSLTEEVSGSVRKNVCNIEYRPKIEDRQFSFALQLWFQFATEASELSSKSKSRLFSSKL